MVKQGVLFVCLGNICRSPMAEIVFKYLVKEKDLEGEWFSDSAGTSAYHIGEIPDQRTLDICRQRLKNSYRDHKARYDPQGGLIVEDPYYGGVDGFNTNFEQVMRACQAFLLQHSNQ